MVQWNSHGTKTCFLLNHSLPILLFFIEPWFSYIMEQNIYGLSIWFNGTYSVRNTENFTTGVAHLFLAVVFFRDFDAG